MTSKQFKPPVVHQGREEAVTSPGLGSFSHNGEQWGSAPTLGAGISPGNSRQELRCSHDDVTPSFLQHRQNTFSISLGHYKNYHSGGLVTGCQWQRSGKHLGCKLKQYLSLNQLQEIRTCTDSRPQEHKDPNASRIQFVFMFRSGIAGTSGWWGSGKQKKICFAPHYPSCSPCSLWEQSKI